MKNVNDWKQYGNHHPRRLRRISALVLAGLMSYFAAPPVSAQNGEMQLTLQDCIQMALENNLDLRVSSYDPRIAETEVTREQAIFDSTFTSDSSWFDEERPAFRAGDFISQEFKSETFRFEDRLQSGFNYNVEFNAFRNEGASLVNATTMANEVVLIPLPFGPIIGSSLFFNFEQPLLKNRGFEVNRTQIRVASNNRLISDSQYRQNVLDKLKQVEEAYWELVFTSEDLEVRRQSLQRAQRFLEENRVKVEVGTLAPIEITTAEAEVASREEDVIVGENSVEDAEDNLRVLLASTEDPMWNDKIVTVDQPAFREVEVDIDANLEIALDNRPDLEQQRLSVENEEMALTQQRNVRKYGLDFRGQYGTRGQVNRGCILPDPLNMTCNLESTQVDDDLGDALDQVFDADFVTWSAGLLFTVPIHNRDSQSQYAAARLRKEQSVVNYELLRQNAIKEVRSSVRQIETNLKRVKAARVNKRLQNEKLDAEEKKYQNGMSTSFQVLEFQEDLAEAERGEIRAVIDFNLSLAELEKVKGTLGDYRGVVIE